MPCIAGLDSYAIVYLAFCSWGDRLVPSFIPSIMYISTPSDHGQMRYVIVQGGKKNELMNNDSSGDANRNFTELH
jgi:hypothetical protein